MDATPKTPDEVRSANSSHDGCIYLIPYGGIARRIRTIASAITVARMLERPLEVIWFTNDSFQCGASRLFNLSPAMSALQISIRDADWKDWLTNDAPRRANLWITYPWIIAHYDRYISSRKAAQLLREEPKQLHELLRDPSELVLLSTNEALISKRGMYEVIEPAVEVVNARNSLISGWGHNVVGIHINRSSHGYSDADAPTELFIRRMQLMIEEDSSVAFFLATTSNDEKDRLETLFKGRIFCSHTLVDYESQEGIIESFGELLALSCTRKIITTPNSSFSEVAAAISNIPIEQLSIFSSVNK